MSGHMPIALLNPATDNVALSIPIGEIPAIMVAESWDEVMVCHFETYQGDCHAPRATIKPGL